MLWRNLFKSHKKKETPLVVIINDLNKLATTLFTDIHSSEFSLIILVAIFWPIELYTQRLIEATASLKKEAKATLEYYKKPEESNSIANFFLTKKNCYGQELLLLNEFILAAIEFINIYEKLDNEIRDDSERNTEMFVYSRVINNLKQIIEVLLITQEIMEH